MFGALLGSLFGASATVSTGKTVSFSVAANGTQPFTYQWYKQGSALTGVTGPVYTIPAVSVADAGNYYAVVANPSGQTTSDLGVLTVTSPAPTAPPPIINYFGHSNSAWASPSSPSNIYWSAANTAKVELIDPNGAALKVPEVGNINITQSCDGYQWTLKATNADGVFVTKIDGVRGCFTAAQLQPPLTIQQKEQQAATAAGVAYDPATRKFGPMTGEEEDALHDARKLLGL